MARGKQAAYTSISKAGYQSRKKKAEPSGKKATAARRRRSVDEESYSADVGHHDASELGDESDGSTTEFDQARIALEELQTVMERGDKNDNFEKEMEKKVMQDEKRLIGMVREEERKWESEEEQFRAQFASLIQIALSPINVKESAPNAKDDDESVIPEDTFLKGHPLYIKTQALLESSNSLITDIENIISYTSKLEAPPDLTEKKWDKDCAEVRRLIKAGREASEAKIEKLLFYEKSPSSGRETRGRKRKREVEDDENLQAMLEMGRDGEESDQETRGWGYVAHQVEKGMKVFTKALP